MSKIVTHPGARTDRNPTPEAIGAIKLHSILQGVGGWGISDDFLSSATKDAAENGITSSGTWTRKEVGAGVSGSAFTQVVGEAGGAFLLDPGTTVPENQGIQVQLLGDSFKPAAGANIYFGTLLKTELLASDVFAGLSLTTTDSDRVLASGDTASSDFVGFFWDQTDLHFRGKKSGVTAESNDTGLALVANTYTKLEFVITDTNSVIPFVNGIRYSEAKLSSPPVVAVTPSLAVTGQGGTDHSAVTIDWVKCYQQQDLVRVGSA